MSRFTPKDLGFNKTVNQQLDGGYYDERVIFIDTDDQVREAIYPAEFDSGAVQRARASLEERGLLKGVLYVSARTFGSPRTLGVRVSVVEYVPENRFYGFRRDTAPATWVTNENDEFFREALIKHRELFDRGEEESTDA